MVGVVKNDVERRIRKVSISKSTGEYSAASTSSLDKVFASILKDCEFKLG